MSTSEKTQDGDMLRFKALEIKEFLETSFPKPVALQQGLLYAGNVHWIVVRTEVPDRMLGSLLCCTVAVSFVAICRYWLV